MVVVEFEDIDHVYRYDPPPAAPAGSGPAATASATTIAAWVAGLERRSKNDIMTAITSSKAVLRTDSMPARVSVADRGQNLVKGVRRGSMHLAARLRHGRGSKSVITRGSVYNETRRHSSLGYLTRRRRGASFRQKQTA